MATTATSTPSPFDNAITTTPTQLRLSKQAIIWIVVISAVVVACMTAVALIMARGLCSCFRRSRSTTKNGTITIPNVVHSPLYQDQRNSFVAWKKWEGQPQISSALPPVSSSHAGYGGSHLLRAEDALLREKAAKARETGIVVPVQSFDFFRPVSSYHGGSAAAVVGARTKKGNSRASLAAPVPVIVESDGSADSAAAIERPQQQRLQKRSRYYSGWPKIIDRNSWRRSIGGIGRAL